MVNSNIGWISHGLGATTTYWSKRRPWDIFMSHLTLSLLVIPCNYVDEPYVAKT